jgi:hypothetical protein
MMDAKHFLTNKASKVILEEFLTQGFGTFGGRHAGG